MKLHIGDLVNYELAGVKFQGKITRFTKNGKISMKVIKSSFPDGSTFRAKMTFRVNSVELTPTEK